MLAKLARLLVVPYWLVSVFLVLAATLYFTGFIAGRYTFNNIDSGLQIPKNEAFAIDIVLLAAFGLAHSILARRAFKRFVHPAVHRSTYLLITAWTLAVIFAKWEPIPNLVWNLTNPAVDFAFRALFVAGGVLVMVAIASIGAADFFGLPAVVALLRGIPLKVPPFRTPGPYRFSRHPAMVGLLVMLWSTPRMSEGHLLFAAVMSLYIVIGTHFEERDLVGEHGGAYLAYRERVRRFV